MAAYCSDDADITILGDESDHLDNNNPQPLLKFQVISGPPAEYEEHPVAASHHALNTAYTGLKKRYNDLEQKHKYTVKVLKSLQKSSMEDSTGESSYYRNRPSGSPLLKHNGDATTRENTQGVRPQSFHDLRASLSPPRSPAKNESSADKDALILALQGKVSQLERELQKSQSARKLLKEELERAQSRTLSVEKESLLADYSLVDIQALIDIHKDKEQSLTKRNIELDQDNEELLRRVLFLEKSFQGADKERTDYRTRYNKLGEEYEKLQSKLKSGDDTEGDRKGESSISPQNSRESGDVQDNLVLEALYQRLKVCMLEMKSLQQIVTEQKNTIHSLQQGQGQGQSQCQGQISQEQGGLSAHRAEASEGPLLTQVATGARPKTLPRASSAVTTTTTELAVTHQCSEPSLSYTELCSGEAAIALAPTNWKGSDRLVTTGNNAESNLGAGKAGNDNFGADVTLEDVRAALGNRAEMTLTRDDSLEHLNDEAQFSSPQDLSDNSPANEVVVTARDSSQSGSTANRNTLGQNETDSNHLENQLRPQGTNHQPRPLNIERNECTGITTRSYDNNSQNINLNVGLKSKDSPPQSKPELPVLNNDPLLGHKPIASCNIYQEEKDIEGATGQRVGRPCPVCNHFFPVTMAMEDFQRHVLECNNPPENHGGGFDADDRVCPVCDSTFPVSIPMENFERHVNAHFDDNDVLSFEVLH